jgi:hypothetical protein
VLLRSTATATSERGAVLSCLPATKAAEKVRAVHRSSGLRLATLLILVGAPADGFASERGTWFKRLQHPATGQSCCDIANCHRTDADWREGRWWVDIRGYSVPVPVGAVLDVKSIDGEAYVCTANLPLGLARPLPEKETIAIIREGIYCFVPPTPGS